REENKTPGPKTPRIPTKETLSVGLKEQIGSPQDQRRSLFPSTSCDTESHRK
ncbi:uncharacterized, partial [Tachysurus ichikawai]